MFTEKSFSLIKLIQTKTQSLIGSESDLNASLLDAIQLLLLPQPMDHHTLEVTPCVQFVFPVIKHGQRGHNEEHLDQIMAWKQQSREDDKSITKLPNPDLFNNKPACLVCKCLLSFYITVLICKFHKKPIN